MNSKFQIKLKLIVLPFCSLFTINSFAQDYQSNVCTPKGTTVIAYITSENSDYWRNYYDIYFASAYPNAIQIETYNGFSSTRRFNCHGYA